MTWRDYDTHARMRPRDDLWGQVRRTVHGQPVSPDQIEMIVDMIVERLALGRDDYLLDLACGNGALSARLSPWCARLLGVDVSPYLIEIAVERFASEQQNYRVADVAEFSETEPDPERFTKALCYGSLSYVDDASVARMLRALSERFPRLQAVLLGNLPDPARVDLFYHARPTPPLREARSDIGVWRSAADIALLAGPGWRVTSVLMPPEFFAAHYRFDALLERAR